MTLVELIGIKMPIYKYFKVDSVFAHRLDEVLFLLRRQSVGICRIFPREELISTKHSGKIEVIPAYQVREGDCVKILISKNG